MNVVIEKLVLTNIPNLIVDLYELKLINNISCHDIIIHHHPCIFSVASLAYLLETRVCYY